MHKDLAYMDYDMIEDKWSKLRQAKVLVADYDLIRRDFSFLTVPLIPKRYSLAHRIRRQLK